jgi:hypothetical protein
MMWMKIVAVFLCVVLAALLPSYAFAQILINEMLADPVTDWNNDSVVDSKADEWLEIVNVGDTAVDISDYRLTDASGGATWRFGFSGTLQPGEVRVVFGSEAVTWQGTNGLPSVGLSLNNGGDTVYLFDVQPGDTAVVDEYTYSSFEVLDDRSTGRVPDGGDTWVLFDALNPYTGQTAPLGTGCMPTPGASNDCSTILPVENSTWGAVKSLYTN